MSNALKIIDNSQSPYKNSQIFESPAYHSNEMQMNEKRYKTKDNNTSYTHSENVDNVNIKSRFQSSTKVGDKHLDNNSNALNRSDGKNKSRQSVNQEAKRKFRNLTVLFHK
jgi:hypothetical protein